ncbi:MAG: hypothetical protein KDB37_17135 [Ilumatobacter sp.]|nr:hypothetical protein [Ilumatobacter sp.]
MAAIVTVDADGCRRASDAGTFEHADLVLPDGVEVSEDDLIVGSGTVTDDAMPQGCDGASGTVTFETVDIVQNMAEPVEPDVNEVLSVEFDQPWGCGRGFVMSDENQQWAIGIEPIAGNTTEAAGTTITLPSEQFGVNVLYGVDLIAGHCEVDREPFAGAPVWLAVWPVTEGSFLYPEASVICDGSSARTELVDAVVETPDGLIELPPIEMVNPAFACGPGWDD